MKKKPFVLVLVGIITCVIISFILQPFFYEQTESFGISGGLFFVSTFCLFCYKNALKPTVKGIGQPINLTKKHFERKGELDKYKTLCLVLLILTISVALLNFIKGLGEIFASYFKSVFL